MSDAYETPSSPAALADPSGGRWVPTGRLYLTSELRAATGLPRTHMDFYLREGIIRPTARTESGYLLFDATELEILRRVLRWREEGVGIRSIRARLGRPADEVAGGAAQERGPRGSGKQPGTGGPKGGNASSTT